MTTAADIITLSETAWRAAPVGEWWKHVMADLIEAGSVQMIPNRLGDGVYLLRGWISKPRLQEHRGPDDGARFESGDSCLLHYFLQPDDDGALHDHPWRFRTELLSGAYVERRPAGAVGELGPALTIDKFRDTGTVIDRQATDLHSVVSIAQDTWTLVRTGPRERDWFFHPAGLHRVPWREYLAALGKEVQPPRAASASA